MTKLVKVECGKCLGKGIIDAYRGIKGGVCFSCSGHGFKMLKHKPQPSLSFRVSFLWLDENDPNYMGGDFCHCWNIKAKSLAAAEKKAKEGMKKNGAADFKVEAA